MKKRMWAISVIGIVLIIFIAAWFIINSLPDKEDRSSNKTSASEQISLVSKEINSIQSVLINSNNSKITINVSYDENEKGTYTIPEIDSSQKISSINAESTVRVLGGLKATEKVSENSENLSEYGLDKTNTSATIAYADGSKTIFYLGGQAPMNKGRYLKIEGDNAVYLISPQNAAKFATTKSSYIETPESENLE